MDGVICLLQPPTETNPVAVSLPYSDASDGSSKYSETVYFPALQEEEEEEDEDEETLSAATGRDPEGLPEVCLNI